MYVLIRFKRKFIKYIKVPLNRVLMLFEKCMNIYDTLVSQFN
nr:hypothetical protein [Mucilaginibacter sp. SP1R1]